MTLLSPAEFLHGPPAIERPARRVSLLEAPRIPTRERRAQQKWRGTESGKASQARTFSKWYANPEKRAAVVERVMKWADENRDRKRAYQRVWARRKRRAARASR